MKDEIESAVKSTQGRDYVPIYKFYPNLLHKGHSGSLTLKPYKDENQLTISEYYFQVRVHQTYDSAINKTVIELWIMKEYPKWLEKKMNLVLKPMDLIKYDKDFYKITCGPGKMSFAFEMSIDGLNFLSIYYLIPILDSFKAEFSDFIKNIKTTSDRDFVNLSQTDYNNFIEKFLWH